MKALVSILENKDIEPSSSLTKSNIIVSTIPKALIIKLEDVNPHELYTEMKKANKVMNQDQLSDWYVNNRQHCVNYIRKCCDKFKLRDNSFFAALSYADRAFRSSSKLSAKAYDISIISCIVLATKYAENDAYELDLNDFHTLEGNNVYNMHEIKEREVKTIKELHYDLHIPTAYDYFVCQMSCGVIFKDEFPDKLNVNKFYLHSKSLLIQVISSKWGLIHPPEILSLCVISLARNYFGFTKSRMNNIKDKLRFGQKVKYDECLQDISNIIDSNATFLNKNSKKQKDKRVKANNQLCLSNPEVLSQIKRNNLRKKIQITHRAINTIKVQTFESKYLHRHSRINKSNNFNSKKKPLDSTCSTIKPESCSIYDPIHGANTKTTKTNPIKPKNISSIELFNFKNNYHCISNRNQRVLFTNCDLPIIERRK